MKLESVVTSALGAFRHASVIPGASFEATDFVAALAAARSPGQRSSALYVWQRALEGRVNQTREPFGDGWHAAHVWAKHALADLALLEPSWLD